MDQHNMTTPPSPEAVEAAMKWANGLPLVNSGTFHLRSFVECIPGRGLNHHALRILAAEVERLRGENESLARIADAIETAARARIAELERALTELSKLCTSMEEAKIIRAVL